MENHQHLSMMSELGRELFRYAAAKGGLKMLTKTFVPNTVNTIFNVMEWAGYIATRKQHCFEKQPDGSLPSVRSIYNFKTPACSLGTPEDLKGPAVFLLQSFNCEWISCT